MKYCISLVLILLSTSAYAELHKWVDATGKVHYSDTAPPADAKEQQVRIPQSPAGTTGEAPVEKSIFEREADMEKALKTRKEAEQKAAQEQKDAESKRQNCENARNSLQALQNAPRIASYDANGNQTFMNDVARQEKIDEAHKAVSEFCD